MSLKGLIQRLLDSRTTPKQASHSAMPSLEAPVIYKPSNSVSEWGQVLSNTVAVSDGYIRVSGRTTALGGFLQINGSVIQVTTSGTSIGAGEMLNTYIPISKGQSFNVYARHLGEITARLMNTIGGGG